MSGSSGARKLDLGRRPGAGRAADRRMAISSAKDQARAAQALDLDRDERRVVEERGGDFLALRHLAGAAPHELGVAGRPGQANGAVAGQNPMPHRVGFARRLRVQEPWRHEPLDQVVVAATSLAPRDPHLARHEQRLQNRPRRRRAGRLGSHHHWIRWFTSRNAAAGKMDPLSRMLVSVGVGSPVFFEERDVRGAVPGPRDPVPAPRWGGCSGPCCRARSGGDGTAGRKASGRTRPARSRGTRACSTRSWLRAPGTSSGSNWRLPNRSTTRRTIPRRRARSAAPREGGDGQERPRSLLARRLPSVRAHRSDARRSGRGSGTLRP